MILVNLIVVLKKDKTGLKKNTNKSTLKANSIMHNTDLIANASNKQKVTSSTINQNKTNYTPLEISVEYLNTFIVNISTEILKDLQQDNVEYLNNL